MEVKRKLYKKIGMQNFHYFSSSPHKLLNPLDSKGNYSPTSYNNEVGTLAIDGWAVTFGAARRGLGGLQYPPRCIRCKSPPISGQSTSQCIAK